MASTPAGLPLELEQLSLAALAQGIAAGDIRAEDCVAASLRRAKETAALNAFVTIAPEDALLERGHETDRARSRGAPLGALAGIPMAVKDNINTRLLPTTSATRALMHLKPAADAPIVQMLTAHGALVFGKTNLHELSFGPTSEQSCIGAVCNPYDPSRVAGGSSGGTAAAIAARVVPAGLGSDTGGSCRIPASLCGVAGFRPSIVKGRRRYPSDGVAPLSSSRDTVGTLARSAADLAFLDSVITNSPRRKMPALESLRFGLPVQQYWRHLDGEVRAICMTLLERLRGAGATLVEVDLPDFDAYERNTGRTLVLGEFVHCMRDYLREHFPHLRYEDVKAGVTSPGVLDSLERSEACSAHAYLEALAWARRLKSAYQRHFDDNGLAALLLPTTRMTAPPQHMANENITVGGLSMDIFSALVANTTLTTNAGLPALTIPAGLTRGGLPVGIEIDGRAGDDALILAIGCVIEQLIDPLPRPAAR